MSATDFNVILEQISSKISLSEIIGREVVLKRKGREHIGNCPFHIEKTSSFFVNDEKGKYYCFGCGAHGDMLSYVMQTKGYNFKQALEYLANTAGIKLPENKVYKKEDKKVHSILQECAKYFNDQLKQNSSIMEYCKTRGLDNDVIENFSIGYCPKNINDLLLTLKNLGYRSSDISKAGIISDRGAKFSERLIFPVFNRGGNVIAFGGRTLIKDHQPKYINSSDSEIFHKKDVLYGDNIASKNVSTKNKPYIIVEGYMDVVIMHKFGFNTAIASMGTSLSSEHLLNIWKYCNEPVICFDGDSAGRKAMVRAAFLALEHISPGKSMKFAKLPEGQDPDSFLHNNSKNVMQDLLDNSQYLTDFLWKYFVDLYMAIENKSPEHILNWKNEIFNQLSIINNAELKKLYIFEFKDRTFQFVREQRKNKGNKTFVQNIIFSIDKDNKGLLREAILLYTVFKRPSIVFEVSESLACVVFSNTNFEKLCSYILCNSSSLSFDTFDDTIKELEKIADKYCKFDEFEDDDVISFWNEIFKTHVFKNAAKSDLKIAKDECNSKFNEGTWSRLKEIKLSMLKKKID